MDCTDRRRWCGSRDLLADESVKDRIPGNRRLTPESEENLRLLRQLDQLYMKRPFYGSRKVAVELEVNRKRIQRLMRILGIEVHYPKPNSSRPAPGRQIYPYPLRGVAIERPNHVWSTNITYLTMRGSFLYLVAVMNWFSRFVLSWELSNTLVPFLSRGS